MRQWPYLVIVFWGIAAMYFSTYLLYLAGTNPESYQAAMAAYPMPIPMVPFLFFTGLTFSIIGIGLALTDNRR